MGHLVTLGNTWSQSTKQNSKETLHLTSPGPPSGATNHPCKVVNAVFFKLIQPEVAKFHTCILTYNLAITAIYISECGPFILMRHVGPAHGQKIPSYKNYLRIVQIFIHRLNMISTQYKKY